MLWSVNFTFGTAETDIALSFSKLDRVYETDTPPAPSSSDTSSTPSSDGNDSQPGEDSSLAPSGSSSDTPKPGTGDRTAVLPLTAGAVHRRRRHGGCPHQNGGRRLSRRKNNLLTHKTARKLVLPGG